MNIVVTGGSRGIGEAIVKAAAAAGHNVAFTYRQQAEAAKAVVTWVAEHHSATQCRHYQLDVRQTEAIDGVADAIVDDFEEIDAVILNAGINRNGLAVSLSSADWNDVIETNLSGSFFVARAFLNHFLARRQGRLLFMSSIGHRGVTGQAAYAASKAGLLGLSATLAKEYGPRGITSNCIAAGFFDTDMTRDGMSDGNRDFWLKYCPARRLGSLEELAQTALFLVSDAAAFINGQVIPVNGGLDFAP